MAPRDGSNIYSQPFPDVVEDTTIESTVYNGFTNDVSADLNAARPIVAGGTGATSADQALFNLAAEKAAQVVTNYDSHLWVPGSFRSAASATGAPTANAFAGVCYIAEALANPPTNANVVVEARDLDDASIPGKVYVREKKAGVWSAWTADLNAADVTASLAVAVKVDADQSFTEAQKAQGRENIYAAPFDALAYSGMQINGSMEVSQELGSTGRTTSGFICDGWYLAIASGVICIGRTFSSGSTLAGLPAFTFSGAITTAKPSLSAGDYQTFLHVIEGYRIARLGWGTASAQPITIGFWTQHTRTGTYSVVIRNGAANRAYATTYTHSVADTWQFNTVTIPGDTSGTWASDNTGGISLSLAQACGTTFTAPTANTWIAGDYLATTGQINAVAATSDNFRFTGVVILPGIEAPSAARSPLILRPYGQELLTCQRYWHKNYLGNEATVAAANTPVSSTIFYKVDMRMAAAISFVTPVVNINAKTPSAPNPLIGSVQIFTDSVAAGRVVYQGYVNSDARL